MKKWKNTFKEAVCSGLFVAAASMLAVPAVSATDLDGDGTEDFTVYRGELAPVVGGWFTASSSQNFTFFYQWGLADDIPVPGKYSGGMGADIAVWRPSTGVWFRRNFDNSLAFSTAAAFQWGLDGDIPCPCDIDGDGNMEKVVWRESTGTFFILTSASNFTVANSIQWGLPGDEPVLADYDNDGNCDIAVYREGSGSAPSLWFIILSSTSGATAAVIPFGSEGDTPVQGKYDSDNITDLAVFRESTGQWLVRNSSVSQSNLANLITIYNWGLPGDTAVPLDQDGDGKTDIAVFRDSFGIWFVRTSSSNYASAVTQQFGLPGDIPIGTKRGDD